MRRIYVALLVSAVLFFLSSCGESKRKVSYTIRNVEVTPCHSTVTVEDPSAFLKIRRNRRLLLTDGNGFTVPFQRVDSSKVIFRVNIKEATSQNFTFRPTRQKVSFPRSVRYFRNEDGDVFWENEISLFRMHSNNKPGMGGIDVLVKPSGEFVDSLSVDKYMSYNGENTLGCGGVAPTVNGHLLRCGNFEKMELLDSGPIMLRMRFTFPEFELGGRMIHEVRTVSIVSGLNFSQVESQFVGADSLTAVIGIAMKDSFGRPVQSSSDKNHQFEPVMAPGKGFLCYAESGTRNGSGTTYTGVYLLKRVDQMEEMDGHAVVLAPLESNETLQYSVGYSSSLDGMNYAQWEKDVQSIMAHNRRGLKITSFKNE